MKNRCCFGIILNSNCISRRKNEQIDINGLPLMEVELIKLHSAIPNFGEVTGITKTNITKTSTFEIVQTISESAQII